MTIRKYSSTSQETSLTTALAAGDGNTTMVVGSATALMSGIIPGNTSPLETFTVVIDPDTALEEIVDVTYPSTPSSNTLTIVRAVDGTTSIAHSAGAKVRHMASGRDFREANTHIENTTTAHGLTIADVITTTNTKTLTNKTLTSPTITGTGAIAGTFTGNLTGNVTGNVSGSSGSTTGNAATATALATGRTFQLTGDVEASGVTFDGTGNVSLTTVIGTGAIVNADINASAAIDKTKISGTAITAADTGTVTSAMIANDSIVNADINSSAQIAYSKTNLTNSIVNADINASAAIEWTKIAPSSTVSATELGYLDGVTSAVQTQLDSKLGTSTAASTYAPLASPALTGTPTAPTAAANTNTTQIATTAYVQTELADLVNSAPAALDTLNELAASLGNDANFSTTVTNSLATKLPLAGGTMSGNIAMGTNKITGLGTPSTSTDAATKGYVDTAAIAPSNLTGPITSVGPATAVASQTGTGSTFVMQASPTLTTPNIGVATATSINGTTIPASKTLVATDSTTYVVPSQTGNSGKFLTTDGSTSSWGNVAGALAQPTEPSSPQDGQIWIDTDGTAPTTVVTRWTKQPAAGTTSLTGNDDYSIPLAYSAGYEQVFLNGVLLSRSGGEYTATNGTSITLTSATVAGDIVEVICPLQIATTDTYTQSAVNAAFVPKSLTTTTGDIIYASSANTPARLGIGSTSQVLTVSGGVPTWATPDSGSMTLLSTTTLSGASVTLSSIPQTYNQLKIYITAVTNNTADGKLTFKPNDGTNGRWSGTDFNVVYNGTGSVIQPAANISRTNADNGFCFTYDNYTAAGYTNVFHLDGYYYDGGNPRGINIAGSTVSGPVTSFVLANTGGTFSGGTIKLYGVK